MLVGNEVWLSPCNCTKAGQRRVGSKFDRTRSSARASKQKQRIIPSPETKFQICPRPQNFAVILQATRASRALPPNFPANRRQTAASRSKFLSGQIAQLAPCFGLHSLTRAHDDQCSSTSSLPLSPFPALRLRPRGNSSSFPPMKCSLLDAVCGREEAVEPSEVGFKGSCLFCALPPKDSWLSAPSFFFKR